jgi:hypothetical protein
MGGVKKGEENIVWVTDEYEGKKGKFCWLL